MRSKQATSFRDLSQDFFRLAPSREVRLRGQLISLTRKEFDLLHLLVSHPTTVISREEVMSKVWGYVWSTPSRTIDMHVSSLRKKLGGS